MSASLIAVQSSHERALPRHPCEVQTTCQPPSAWRKDPWPAVIRDICTSELSLHLARRFERGSGLAIELPTEQGGTTTVLARINQVEPDQGGWRLGCKLISELSDEEVQAVLNLDPLHQASPEAGTTVSGVVFQTLIRGEVLRWFVKRLDLPGGWPPSVGRVVSFRVGSAAEAALVELAILKCHRVGTYWIINCKFRQEPGDGVLRVLAGGR